MNERRTLIRRQADRALAGVLRGEVSPWDGELVEVPERDLLDVPGTCSDCGGPIERHTAPGWSTAWYHLQPQTGRSRHPAVSR